MKTSFTRRRFLGAAVMAGAGPLIESGAATGAPDRTTAPAAPARPKWPHWGQREENLLLEALHSGRWGRNTGGVMLKEFEAAFAQRMQARFCLATSSGTTALLTSLGALGIGPGDEVVLPAYTFVATFNVITLNYALPIFVDVDPGTFQIDPDKMAAAITPETRLLMPVHIGGSVADLDRIMAVARHRDIPVLEDACQAPLAEWRGRPVGTAGIGGCISFQSSKNITSGEGGAIVTDDENFANLCYNFHLPGGNRPVASSGRASNYRLTEFQGALLRAQLSRMEPNARRRDENAAYLDSMLARIAGITPAKLTPGCTRSAYHLYMFRYDARAFAGLPRLKFLQALSAAGIPATGGYKNLTKMPHVRAIVTNRHYERIYGRAAMRRWAERIDCPVTDALAEDGVWLLHHTLLGPRSEMERLVETILEIRRRAPELARA